MHIIRACLVVLAVTAAAAAGLAQPPQFPAPGAAPPAPRLASYPADLQPTHANVAYATLSKAQVLDLFLPAGTGPFPLVMNVHGGAFRMGSKEMLDAPLAKALLGAGIAVASVNYRLSGEARFPAAVQDVKAAVRFLRANAARYRLDGRNIVAFGQSAGGNLVSMLGTTGALKDFDDPALGNLNHPSSVSGVIDWFGPTDFLQMDAHAKAQGCAERDQAHGAADSPESRYLGVEIGKDPALAARANPISYIGPHTPPFLLQKGERDCTVPVGQSKLLYDALKAAGRPVSLDLLPNAGHGGPLFSAPGNIQRVLSFVQGVTGLSRNNPDQQEWLQLFNGRDLDGWTVKFTKHELGVNLFDTVRVEEGLLRIRYDRWTKAFDGEFGHIFYKQPFSYYRIAAEYRFVGDQISGGPGWAMRNNGLMLHAPDPRTMLKDQDFPISIEIQLLGGLGDGKPRPTANLCTPGTHVVMNGELKTAHCTNSTARTYDGDQWVRVEVEVHGDERIRHIVDGQTVLEYSRPQIGGGNVSPVDPAVKIDGTPLVKGYIALQAETGPTDFRKVEVLNLEGCTDPKALNYKTYFVKSNPGMCRY